MKKAWMISALVFFACQAQAMTWRGDVSGKLSNLMVGKISVMPESKKVYVMLYEGAMPYPPGPGPFPPPPEPIPPKPVGGKFHVGLDLNDKGDAASYELFLKAAASWSLVSLHLGKDGKTCTIELDGNMGPCTGGCGKPDPKL